jgi:hypothetical protein
MKNMKTWLNYLILILTLLASCKHSNRFKVDLKENDTTIYHVRFDKLLGAGTTSALISDPVGLYNENPEFFDLYTQRIIRIGRLTDSVFSRQSELFVTDSIYLMVFDSVQHTFKNSVALEKIVSDGLVRFHYFFPTKDLPKVYYYLSGFNESVMVAPGMLGISLDNYLGSSHTFYSWLGLYEYLKTNMYPEKIASDALYAWIKTECTDDWTDTRLIDAMIEEGKLIFAVSKTLPDEPLYRVCGLTPEQLLWCEDNEAQIWNSIVSWKHLFSTDRQLITKYSGDAPFTAAFGENSAPKAVNYVGFRIVEAYMKQNQSVTMEQLFETGDAQLILENSGYKPES